MKTFSVNFFYTYEGFNGFTQKRWDCFEVDARNSVFAERKARRLLYKNYPAERIIQTTIDKKT